MTIIAKYIQSVVLVLLRPTRSLGMVLANLNWPWAMFPRLLTFHGISVVVEENLIFKTML
jgi:hypothetical protein